MPKRISALDGLRGLAILFVVFNHIPLASVFAFVPKAMVPIVGLLWSNGGTGVYVFFLLTGFLMGSLYPSPRSSLAFWSRRYARLFPPFLVMIMSLTLIQLTKNLSLPLGTELVIVLGCAVLARGLWAGYQHLSAKISLGNRLLLFWLFVQLGTAVGYTLIVLKIPAAVFLEIWHPFIRLSITAVVNATLTLPFGQYIAQLDGIYWALVAEVGFYILYPILFVPLLNWLKVVKSTWVRIILFISVLPFSFGLYLLGQRLLGFELLKLHLIIYFIAGTLLGRNIGWFKRQIFRFRPIISSSGWLLFLLLIVFGHGLILSYVPKFYHPWIQIGAVFPISLFLATAIDQATYTSKWLSQPVLVFLGKYSFSLYLTHSFVAGLVNKMMVPASGLAAIPTVALALSGAIALSWCLYQLAEKPYFDLRQRSAKNRSFKLNLPDEKQIDLNLVVRRRIIDMTLVILGLLYFAYKPPLAMFTFTFRHDVNGFWPVFDQRAIVSLRDRPIRLSFVAPRDNLGMIMTHVRNLAVENATDSAYVPSSLLIRLRNDQGEVIAQSSYETYQIIDSIYHPFGIPVQPASKGKSYTLEYQLSTVSPSRDLEIITTEGSFLSVYFVNKQTLLHQLPLAADWLVTKLTEPFKNRLFWYTFFQLAPFLLCLTGIYLFKQRQD